MSDIKTLDLMGFVIHSVESVFQAIVTYGNGFKIESKGWGRHEQLGFRNSRHSALLEIYVKSAY